MVTKHVRAIDTDDRTKIKTKFSFENSYELFQYGRTHHIQIVFTTNTVYHFEEFPIVHTVFFLFS